jgi:serpin B
MVTKTCMTIAAVLLASMSLAQASVPVQKDEYVAQTNNAFASDLYAQLAAKDGNLFFSPTSIQTALAMAWEGARGQTADEMAKILHLDAEPKAKGQLGGFVRDLNAGGAKGGYELAMANALWGTKGYPFMPDYLRLVKTNYDGKLSELDFIGNAEGSRLIINDWVAAQTHDRIRDLLGRGVIGPSTRLVLTNAIYFKGKWDQPFDKGMTKEGEFTMADGKTAKASFMHQQDQFLYAEDDDVQVLGLTYGKNDLAMRVFLPKKTDGLTAFEKKMTAQRIAGLVSGARAQDVNVSLPRFTMQSEFSLADTLAAMGMKLAFDPDRADFKGMTTAEQLFISAVIHKAFVKVDEEGTEAAAATAVTMHAASIRIDPPKPKEFKADHPFVFEIVHQPTGAVLFMGRMATP